jgi:HPt (histidine-containing phosphotransfer) domain-containing protein
MTPKGPSSQGDQIVVHVDPDLAPLIPAFLEDRRHDIATIREALDRGDYETIQVLGHNMKGNGGGYGFDPITDIGSALEQAAMENNSEAVRQWVGELSTYLARVEVVYD